MGPLAGASGAKPKRERTWNLLPAYPASQRFNMQDRNKFAYDVALTFIASLTNIFLLFLLTLFLSRRLGASDLGLYRMSYTVYEVGLLVAAAGIPAAVVKYVAGKKKNSDEFNTIVSSGVATSTLLGLGLFLLLNLLSGPLSRIFNMPELSGLLRILSFVFPFAMASEVLLGMLNGLREMKNYGIARILYAVLVLSITLTLVYLGLGVSGVMIAILLSYATVLAFIIWSSRRYLRLNLGKCKQTSKELLTFGLPILGSNLISLITYRADIILVGYFLTTSDVGYYGVAAWFMQFLWVIPGAIQLITYPATSEYTAAKNKDALKLMVGKSMKYTACILLPAGLFLGFFAGDILPAIFGEAFASSVTPLRILLFGGVIFGIYYSVGASIAGAGRPDLGLRIAAVAAITSILLNLVLIPALGIPGAALATTLSLSLSTLLGLSLTLWLLRISVDYFWYVKVACVTMLAMASLSLLKFANHYVVGVVVTAAYIAVILAYLLGKDDREYFKVLVKDARQFLKGLPPAKS